jgi:hypothetical protein
MPIDVLAFTGSLGLTDVANQRLLVTFWGSLQANNNDHRVLLRVNGTSEDYRSFVIMGGDVGSLASEMDTAGLYVVRNGYHQDYDFSGHYFLSSAPDGAILTGHGMSTFYLANDKVLGFSANGCWTHKFDVTSIELIVAGGFAGTGGIAAQIIN